MKNIQIREGKIDYLKLIRAALNKQDWGKVYVIRTFQDISINLQIESVNFIRNVANFKVSIITAKQSHTWQNNTNVSYNLSNFTIDEFKRLMAVSIERCLRDYIRYIAGSDAEAKYKDLLTYSFNVTTEILERSKYAAELAKIREIDNKCVRNEMIDKLKYLYVDEINVPYVKLVENAKETAFQNKTTLVQLYDIIYMENNKSAFGKK